MDLLNESAPRAQGRCRAGLAMAVLILGFASQAFGALVPLSFEELTKRSELVVSAVVVDTRSYTSSFKGQAFAGEGRCMFTDVNLKWTRVLKGRVETSEITVQIVGGRIGKNWERCAEAARYSKGERVLVFLRRRNGKLRTTGWLQGKYRLKDDKAGRTMVVGKKGLPISTDLSLDAVESQVRLYTKTSSKQTSRPSVRKAEVPRRETRARLRVREGSR